MIQIPEPTRFADRLLQRFAEQTREVFRALELARFLDGTLIEVPAQNAAGAFVARHGLRRVPRGWLVLYQRVPAGTTGHLAVYHRTGEQLDASALQLYASGAFDLLRIWVF